MDGESSCESDISESWSLIDLNLNEQLADGKSIDIQSTDPPEATPKEIRKNENDCKNDEKKIPAENFELMEFSNNANQLEDSQTVISSAVDSPKKEPSSTEPFQDFIFLNDGNRVEEIGKEKSDLHENVKFNLNDEDVAEGEHKARDTDFDTDGISVISDAECAECDETRFYSNENDKNWEEELQTEYLNNAFERNNQTVIKKRRRRVKVYSDSSDDNLNSDLVVPDRRFSDSFSSNNDEMQVSVNATKPVYRHYRNNVANTVLSLAMGVIFAGVACIALGHFLGVHDAEQTAGEMMEALKRLQMENIQLQSRLSHLSRVFFTREIHQKPDLTPNNFPTQNCIDSDLNQQIYKTEDIKKDNNGELNGETQNDFKSISKIANLINKGDLVNSKLETNIENILHQIHDHMTFLNNVSKNDPKLKRFQELDSKIAGFVDKLAQNPPKTEIGLDNLLRRLQKFSEKLKQKLCKNYSDIKLNCGIKRDYAQDKDQNLNLFQWFPVKEENQYPMINLNSVTSNENPRVLYNFPQPEKYYDTSLMSPDVKNSGESDVVIEEELESDQEGQKEKIISSTPAPLPLEYVPITDPSNVVKIEVDQKIINNNNFRSNKTNEYKKKDKKRKEEKRKYDKSSDFKKIKKEKYKFDEVKNPKYDKENAYKEKYNKKIGKEYLKKKKYDEHKEEKKFYKKDDRRKETKPSDKIKNKSYKNTQKEKFEKKSKKDYYKNSDNHWENNPKKYYKNKKNDARYVKNPNAKLYNQINFNKYNKCGSNCHNMSGEWVYKMAKGREQCRRHKRLSDWQFDRAKSRENLRDVEEGNWFFERAAARENDRDDAKWYFKRYDARHHQRKGFSPETFSWI